MEEIMLLSHNDMDGAGCEIVLDSKFHIDSIIHTNYVEIVAHLKLIDEKLTLHSKVVFITDLNFDEAAFIELFRLAMNHTHVKFIYIDHHIYEGRTLELMEKIQKLDNVTVSHDTTKCATMLCYDFIKSKDEDLGRLVRFINAYDIYLEEQPEFKVGYLLNTIFWAIKMNPFKIALKRNNYNIPKKFISMNREIEERKDEAFERYEANGLIVKDDENKILLAMSDDYKSYYVHDFPDYNVYILPNVKSNNISMRIRDMDKDVAEKLKAEILDMVSTYPRLISAGGHIFAFGISIDPDAPKDEVFMLIDEMVKIISTYTNPLAGQVDELPWETDEEINTI